MQVCSPAIYRCTDLIHPCILTLCIDYVALSPVFGRKVFRLKRFCFSTWSAERCSSPRSARPFAATEGLYKGRSKPGLVGVPRDNERSGA